jgi:hypothetical protein
MAFTQQELPPIFQKIITAMEENNGKMTTEEFKKFLVYQLRVTKKDIKEIKQWLKKENYIDIEHGYQTETIHLNDFHPEIKQQP